MTRLGLKRVGSYQRQPPAQTQDELSRITGYLLEKYGNY